MEESKVTPKKRKLIRQPSSFPSSSSLLEDIANTLKSAHLHLQSITNIYNIFKNEIVRDTKESTHIHSELAYINDCLKEFDEMLTSKFNHQSLVCFVCFSSFPITICCTYMLLLSFYEIPF